MQLFMRRERESEWDLDTRISPQIKIYKIVQRTIHCFELPLGATTNKMGIAITQLFYRLCCKCEHEYSLIECASSAPQLMCVSSTHAHNNTNLHQIFDDSVVHTMHKFLKHAEKKTNWTPRNAIEIKQQQPYLVHYLKCFAIIDSILIVLISGYFVV